MSGLQKLIQSLKHVEKSEWIDDAACRGKGADLFFPNFADAATILRRARNYQNAIARQRKESEEAIKICNTCPVIEFCERDHKHEPDGIWFGTVPAERHIGVKASLECSCIFCKTRRITVRGINSERNRLGQQKRREGDGTRQESRREVG